MMQPYVPDSLPLDNLDYRLLLPLVIWPKAGRFYEAFE